MNAKHLRPGRLHRLTRRPSIGRISTCLLLFVLLSLVIGPVRSLAQSSSLRLLVSRSPDRSAAVALAGQSLSGPIYVFVSSRGTITEVAFGLDGSTHNLESSRPFDFNGTAADGTARPWSPTAGGHTITAKIALKVGEVRTLSAAFSVPVQSSTTTSSSTTTTQATTTTAPPPTTAPTTTTAPAAAAPSCTGLRVPAGSSVQAAIDNNPDGATLCLGTGVHRLTRALAPKAGQRLIGEPGAVLNGAVRVTSFSQTGTTWVARGVVTTSPSTNGVCMPGYSGCRYSEAVFYDNRPLWRVMSLAELSPGEFYQDYTTGTLYLADDPTGHEVEVARAKAGIINSASAVTVRGLIVEKFANDAQRGAVIGASDWTIERNQVRLNHGVGIQTPEAQRVKVLANYVHHNGQLGISGWRASGLYEGNELAFNNTAGFYNADWEAGGAKWCQSQGLTVRNNYVHDNKAIGLWFDIDTRDVTIEGNRIEGNDSDGIRFEISYRAVIRGNTITGNGFKEPTHWVNGAGIMVNSAKDVQVIGNLVDSNYNGIMLRQDDRGSGSLGPYVVENSLVQDNQVIMQRGTTGIASTDSIQSVYTANNRFQDNHYTAVGSDPTNFAWKGDERTWTDWQQYGNDPGGSFIRR